MTAPLSLLKNIPMPIHVRTTSLLSWGVRNRYLAVALAAQSGCHVAYADPSAIRLQTAPQARANKNLRRNRLPKSTSGPFPSATPPTWHLYVEGQRASKTSIWKEADAAHLHTQHEFCWRDHIYTNLGVGIVADVILPSS
jgi:hypothetical protein